MFLDENEIKKYRLGKEKKGKKIYSSE